MGMAYQTFLNLKRGELGVVSATPWMLLWVLLMVVTLFPEVFRRLVAPVHVARLLDLVTIGGMLLLVFVVYRLFVLLRRMQRSLDSLVRELALRDLGTDS